MPKTKRKFDWEIYNKEGEFIDILTLSRDEAKIYIPKLYQLGCKLVLWTARKEPYYSECINILKEHNLLKYFSFDYDTGYSGKLIADFYLDDRSCLEEFNWKNWYTFIEECIK